MTSTKALDLGDQLLRTLPLLHALLRRFPTLTGTVVGGACVFGGEGRGGYGRCFGVVDRTCTFGGREGEDGREEALPW